MVLFSLLRIEEVARFATLGAPLNEVARFAWVALPQLIILALPLSCLVGTYLVWHRLSGSSELLGALTSGMSMNHFLLPTLAWTIFLGGVNAALALNWAPNCQLQAKLLRSYWEQVNPAHLLCAERVWYLPGATALSHQTRHELEVFIASYHAKQNSSQLIHLGNLKANDHAGIDIDSSTQLTFYPREHAQYLNLESIAKSSYGSLLHLSAPERVKVSMTMLPLSSVIARLNQDEEVTIGAARQLHTEIPRRLFFGILPVTLSFLAMAAGCQPDRRAKETGMRPVLLWTVTIMAGYFLAKSALFPSLASAAIYLGLPILPIATSYANLKFKGAAR